MIVSLLYKVARKLLSVPGVLLSRDSTKAAELLVLRHENAVLRRQIAGPVRYEPADQFWLAALSKLIPRRRWRETDCEVQVPCRSPALETIVQNYKRIEGNPEEGWGR
ncbi:hypothetical protein [Streptomyces aureus]|uniref:hypothetical protein n=1 Tax=Streptomyces aureus TaxID=193461 RepID=UPI0031E25FD3